MIQDWGEVCDKNIVDSIVSKCGKYLYCFYKKIGSSLNQINAKSGLNTNVPKEEGQQNTLRVDSIETFTPGAELPMITEFDKTEVNQENAVNNLEGSEQNHELNGKLPDQQLFLLRTLIYFFFSF